jgi:hypothetical protein
MKDMGQEYICSKFLYIKKINMIVPHTEWLMPTEFPDLRNADEIAIDLETT